MASVSNDLGRLELERLQKGVRLRRLIVMRIIKLQSERHREGTLQIRAGFLGHTGSIHGIRCSFTAIVVQIAEGKGRRRQPSHSVVKRFGQSKPLKCCMQDIPGLHRVGQKTDLCTGLVAA